MTAFQPEQHPHRRWNPLTGEWVLVSPHRMKRPWHGQIETPPSDERPRYDPACYLCPGNERAGGATNPDYAGTHVFTNDYPALLPEEHTGTHVGPLLRSEPVHGTSRVVCFSPRHDLTLPQMPLEAIETVIEVWVQETLELGEQYRWVQVFQNKGAMMGASNPHPHGQIWAGDWLPLEITKEAEAQAAYKERHGGMLLLDYARFEHSEAERVVVANEHWLAVVPYWAVWPFEALLMPAKRHILRLSDLTPAERRSLATVLKRLLTRYDNLFETAFPYSMGWHAAPNDDRNNDHWQLHAHFYPPLLRSATVRKFLVGYEMLAEPQRDLTAEHAAARLRTLPEMHYLEG